jgi:hypothetical protein
MGESSKGKLDSLTHTQGRFELPQFEQLTSLQTVLLETPSTEAGFKNFVVASSLVDRGEDLAARGAVSCLMPF